MTMQIDTGQWTLPEVTTHQGISVGAVIPPEGSAWMLSQDWDEATFSGDHGIEVWAMCTCGWAGLHARVIPNQLSELGRAGVEDFALLREQWEQHAHQEHGAGRDEPAELRRAAELLTAWRRRDPITALLLLRSLGHMVDGQLADTVVEARQAGHSWAKVAEPLGVTKAAAYERYKAIDPLRWDGTSPRCDAAELLTGDSDPCEGTQEAVRIFGPQDIPPTEEQMEHGGTLACVRHGSRLYATLPWARLRPVGGPSGENADAAMEVYHRAQALTGKEKR